MGCVASSTRNLYVSHDSLSTVPTPAGGTSTVWYVYWYILLVHTVEILKNLRLFLLLLQLIFMYWNSALKKRKIKKARARWKKDTRLVVAPFSTPDSLTRSLSVLQYYRMDRKPQKREITTCVSSDKLKGFKKRFPSSISAEYSRSSKMKVAKFMSAAVCCTAVPSIARAKVSFY